MERIQIDADNPSEAIIFQITDETRLYALEEEDWFWILNHEQILEDGISWGVSIDEVTDGLWCFTNDYDNVDHWIDIGRDAINQMYVGDRVQLDYLTIRRVV